MSIHRLSISVIDTISKIPELSSFEIHKLKNIPLGYLRKNNKTMLGCCRFKKNSRWVKRNKNGKVIEKGKDFWPYEDTLGPDDVRIIDLHPDLFSESRWERLAASVLYHEYLHALGFRHCPTFRKLESLWPDVEARLGTRNVKLNSPMYNLWLQRKKNI